MIEQVKQQIKQIPTKYLIVAFAGAMFLLSAIPVVSALTIGFYLDLQSGGGRQATDAQRNFAYDLRQSYKYQGIQINARAASSEVFEVTIYRFNAEYFRPSAGEFTNAGWLHADLRKLGFKKLIVEDASGGVTSVPLE